MQGLKKKPNATLDGKEIKVYANIGNAGDVGLVLQNDVQGIGLFRSEFIYLDSQDFPTEDQQFMLYKRVAETMAGKKVIIRTLDIGADKQADYFQLDKEDNPALGYRAIRICLTRKEVFKTQLWAILRASAFGTVSIMFPMIISVREIRDAKEILEECKAELKERGLAIGEVEVGIMIETPAAVMMADELAEEVDFFSLGTNDLTQYTLAIDCQNPKLDNFYAPHHPAVLRMIRHTVEAGHRHGCWVGICGELGADPTLTETFLRMGLDELSVSPSAVLPLRKLIRGLDLSKAEELSPAEEELSGKISIGCGELLSVEELSDLISAFQREHPLVQFHLHSGYNDDTKEKIEQGILDLGLLVELVDISKYEFVRMRQKEEWGILVHRNSPLALLESILPENLSGQPVITTMDTPIFRELASWMGGLKEMQIRGTYNLLYNAAMIARKSGIPVMCIKLNCHYDDLVFVPMRPKLELSSVLAWKEH